MFLAKKGARVLFRFLFSFQPFDRFKGDLGRYVSKACLDRAWRTIASLRRFFELPIFHRIVPLRGRYRAQAVDQSVDIIGPDADDAAHAFGASGVFEQSNAIDLFAGFGE